MQMTGISTRIEDGEVLELPTDDRTTVDVSAFRSGQWYHVWLQASAPGDSEMAEYEVSISRVSDGEEFEVPDNYDYGFQMYLHNGDYLYVTLTEVAE